MKHRKRQKIQIGNSQSDTQVEDAYETYYMEMIICGEKIRVELVQCFPKWADINNDGEINNADIEALKYKVE
jgi:hypothetical protein